MHRAVSPVLLIFTITLSAIAHATCAGAEVPKEIAVPPGHKLLAKFSAVGVQIYKAVEGRTGKLEWALEAALADLSDAQSALAGRHYEGPSWEATDGSKVVRDKADEVKSHSAPDATRNIPWLLVKVKAEADKPGLLSPAVYVQRMDTAGGKSLAEPPKHVGTKIGVAYRAVYYFYAKAQ